MDRQKITLIILIALLMIAVYLYSGLFEDDSEEGIKPEAMTEPVRVSGEVIPLNDEIMEKPLPRFKMGGRNLFAFGREGPSLAQLEQQRQEEEKRRREHQEKREQQKERLEQERQQKEPTEPKGPVVPPVFYEFIGYIGPEGNRIAIFKQEDKNWLKVAREGDTFNNYIVKEIGYESVLLGFTNSEAEKRIPLVGGGG